MYWFAIMKYFVSCRRIRHKEVFLYFFIPLFINYFNTIALLNAVRIRFLVHKNCVIITLSFGSLFNFVS